MNRTPDHNATHIESAGAAARTPVEVLHVEEARRRLDRHLAGHEARAAKWRKDRYGEDPDAAKAAKGNAPQALADPSTGVGKTSAIIALQASSPQPSVYVTDRRRDADRPVQQHPLVFMRRRPRENAPGEANNCAMMPGGILARRPDGSAIVIPDGWTRDLNDSPLPYAFPDAYHSVGGEICPKCPKGMLRAVRNPRTRLTPWQIERMQKKLDQYFSMGEQDLIADTLCWLDENAQAIKTRHISVTTKGFNASDHGFKPAPDEPAEERSVGMDETLPGIMGKILPLRRTTIASVLENIADHRKRAFTEKGNLMSRLHLARTEKGEDGMRARIDEIDAEVVYGRRCEPVCLAIINALTENAADESADDRMAPESLLAATQAFLEAGPAEYMAAYEKAVWKDLVELEALPERLMQIIIESISEGSATLNGDRLMVFQSSLIGQLILDRDTPFSVVDATPDQTLKAVMIRKNGATYTPLKAVQNMEAHCDHRRYRGVGAHRGADGQTIPMTPEMTRAEAQRKLREAAHTETLLEPNGVAWVHMGNKAEMVPLLEEVSGRNTEGWDQTRLRELADQFYVGWNGLHDRAHDQYAGMNIHLWGDPSTPDDERIMLYRAHRAALIHAGLPAMPIYVDRWLARGRRTATIAGKPVPFPRRTHAVPEIHEYLQALVDNGKLQTVGRNRAVNSPITLHAALHGGTPCVTLEENGITAIPAHLDPAPTDRDRKTKERQDAFARIDLVMTELVRDGKAVTRKNLNRHQRETGQPQTGQPQTAPETYAQWLASPHVLPFAEHLARTGRGAQYAKKLERALARGREDITERDIEQRIEDIRLAQIRKGGVVTGETVLRGMLADARRLYESDDILDRLAGEVITSVLTGDGSIYYTTPPAMAPPAAA